MLYKKLNQRNVVLLASAHKGLSLAEVNQRLSERVMDPINDLDWALWTNFYLPLAIDNTVYEQEIVYNNRNLSWFANDLKRRHKKTIIS